MIRIFAAVVAIGLAHPVAAQEDGGAFDFAGDVFRAGGTIAFAEPDARDVFLAGERVDLAGQIAGSAHLAGRRVESAGAIGGALYAVAGTLRVTGAVSGAATLVGYDVTIDGAIGGNLRAAGATIELGAPVAGGALLAANRVEINAAIAGDASIAADEVAFGEGARVDGQLTLFEEAGATIDVPASVVPPERIERRLRDEERGRFGPSRTAMAAGFVISALVLAVLAALAATLAPRGMALLAAIVSAGPFRTLGAGFLAQSALVGAAIVLTMTLIGVVLAPFALVAAALLGFLGYVAAVYLVGAWAVTRAGALEPDTFAEYALAGLAGALLVSLLALLPYLGWLVALALSLTGAGAITIAVLRPRLDARR